MIRWKVWSALRWDDGTLPSRRSTYSIQIEEGEGKFSAWYSPAGDAESRPLYGLKDEAIFPCLCIAKAACESHAQTLLAERRAIQARA